ncbi:MAG: OmpA family protein [Methyloligellaceae bacterium]
MRLYLVPFMALLALAPLGATEKADAADQTNSENLVKALQSKKPKMRGFNAGPPAASKNRAFINNLTTRGTRAITVEERKELVKIVKEENLPTIDMTIFFDFNSATIRPSSLKTVDALGKALADKRLKGNKFMIAGHTDAKGTDGYNQKLSEARAKSVRDYLVGSYKLDPKALLAVGFGEEQLKIKGDPLADENRRVQVTNLEK